MVADTALVPGQNKNFYFFIIIIFLAAERARRGTELRASEATNDLEKHYSAVKQGFISSGVKAAFTNTWMVSSGFPFDSANPLV